MAPVAHTSPSPRRRRTRKYPVTAPLPYVFNTPRKNKLASSPRNHLIQQHLPQFEAYVRGELKDAIYTECKGAEQSLLALEPQPIGTSDSLLRSLKRKKKEDFCDLYDFDQKCWVDCPDLKKTGEPGQLEKKMASFLNLVGTHLATARCRCRSDSAKSFEPLERIWTSGSSLTALEGTTERKPDLGLYPMMVDASKGHHWTNLIAIGEITTQRRNSTSPPSHPHPKMMQTLIQKAILILDGQAPRRFVLGFGLWCYDFFLMVFDRSGVVACSAININTQPLTFIRILTGFYFSPWELLGYDHTISRPLSPDDSRMVTTCKKNVYQILHRIFSSRSLRGRATSVFTVKNDSGSVQVLKDGWVTRSRAVTEPMILKRAAERNIRGVPRLIESEDVVTSSGVPDSTYLRRPFLAEDATLPFVVYQKIKEEPYKPVEDRIHRRLIMEPHGEAVTFFNSRKELLSVLRDVVIGMFYIVIHFQTSLINRRTS